MFAALLSLYSMLVVVVVVGLVLVLLAPAISAMLTEIFRGPRY